MKRLKVAVGLSGGVDSAVAAALLKEQNYKVTGVFLECWNEPECRTDEDREDALGVALKLKIPFKVLDFKKEYRQKVLDVFYREYKAGRTPNPDVVCNQEIKFGLFLKWVLKNKFDYMATGHYARIKLARQTLARHAKFPGAQSLATLLRLRSGSRQTSSAPEICVPVPIHLLRSVDEQKDQTYFLAMLKQEQLRRVLFPIGHLTKKQVRLEAKKRGLKVWNKKDSTGICFVGHDLSFDEFLRRKIKEHKGKVMNKKGRVIGKHKGVEFYTIGQRHGLEILEKSMKRPRYFVIRKMIERNRLIVGKRQDLARKEFAVEGWNKIFNFQFSIFKNLKCRIRHQGRLIPCKIMGRKVRLSQSEYGIAPGQVAVIYSGFECLGGGVIR